MLGVNVSKHAFQRQGQRNISDLQLSYVLQHGTPIQRSGVTFVVLRRKDIPTVDRRMDTFAKLEGTIVLVADHEVIVTVYRNPAPLPHVRKKMKYRLVR